MEEPTIQARVKEATQKLPKTENFNNSEVVLEADGVTSDGTTVLNRGGS